MISVNFYYLWRLQCLICCSANSLDA